MTITVGSSGTRHETASFTSTTQYIGTQKSAGAIKVGDHVAVAIVQNSGQLDVYAIQDPGGSPGQQTG
jgi:hypothetical protein